LQSGSIPASRSLIPDPRSYRISTSPFYLWEALHFIAAMKNPSSELNAGVLLAALQDWLTANIISE
jgi:hypothetical protein